MADSADKPNRKSVSFSDGTTIVDGDGHVTKVNGAGDHDEVDKPQADASVDEVTVRLTSADVVSIPADPTQDMFKDLAKKKKKKPAKHEGEDGDTEKAIGDDGEIDLSQLKKKKKKKKAADTDDFEAKLKEVGEAGGDDDEEAEKAEKPEKVEEEGDMIKGTGLWAHDANTPIPYNQLLQRFFALLHERNPDLAGGSVRSFKIPPPSCLREGNKKTIFANLPEIAKRLKRSDEHITQFLFAEMGTTGSVDASKRLVIKGKFQSKQIENILRRYIVEYVTCKTCKSPDTELIKGEARLNYLQCNSCSSRRSVIAIKSGFSAQIGKRKRQQG